MVSSRKKTVASIQEAIESALERLSSIQLPPALEALRFLAPPPGMSPRVSLCKGDTQRQIRSNADASYWNPRSCEAVIFYEEAADDAGNLEDSSSSDPVLDDLVKTLDQAERDPRYRDFVGLKSFRDQYLADRSGPWAGDAQQRQTAIENCIERGVLASVRIPNPKNPNFPTAAIRLRREHPDVKRILKASTTDRSVFRPTTIRGEALSSTILAGRR